MSDSNDLSPQQVLEHRGIWEAAQDARWASMSKQIDGEQIAGWQIPVCDPTGQSIIAHRWKNGRLHPAPGTKCRWHPNKPETEYEIYYVLPDTRTAIERAGGLLFWASGEPDLLTFRQIGANNVLCWFDGEGRIPETFADDMKRFGVTRIVHYPDGDDTGTRQAANMKAALRDSGIVYDAYQLEVPGEEKPDINKLWMFLKFDLAEMKARLKFAPHLEVPDIPSPAEQLALIEQEREGKSDTVSHSSFFDYEDRYAAYVAELKQHPALQAVKKEGRALRFHCVNPSHQDAHPSARISYDKDPVLGIYVCHCETNISWQRVGDWLGQTWDDYKKAHPARMKQQEASPPVPPIDLSAAPSDEPKENGNPFLDVRAWVQSDDAPPLVREAYAGQSGAGLHKHLKATIDKIKAKGAITEGMNTAQWKAAVAEYYATKKADKKSAETARAGKESADIPADNGLEADTKPDLSTPLNGDRDLTTDVFISPELLEFGIALDSIPLEKILFSSDDAARLYEERMRGHYIMPSKPQPFPFQAFHGLGGLFEVGTPGDIYGFVGMSGFGKTSFLESIIDISRHDGNHWLWVSPEIPYWKTADRLVQRWDGATVTDSLLNDLYNYEEWKHDGVIRFGKRMEDKKLEESIEWAKWSTEWPGKLYMIDTFGANVQFFFASIYKAIYELNRQGIHIACLALDYIQLMHAPRGWMGQYTYADMLNQFKALCMTLRCTGWVTSQMRKSDTNEVIKRNKKTVSQDAALYLYDHAFKGFATMRPGFKKDPITGKNQRANYTTFNVTKNSEGRLGVIELETIWEQMRFADHESDAERSNILVEPSEGKK